MQDASLFLFDELSRPHLIYVDFSPESAVSSLQDAGGGGR